MKKLVFIAEVDWKNSPKVRDQIIPEVVDDYAERYKKREKMPLPRIAQLDSDGKWLVCIDGMHRMHALKQNGQKAVECEVTKMEPDDVVKEALACNRTHGLRRSNADKRVCIATALSMWPDKSNLAVSQLTGVDDKTVNVVRKDLEKQGKLDAEAERKDSKDRPVKVREPKTKPEAGRDATGFPIPKDIIPLWEEGERVVEVLDSIATAKSALIAAQKEKDILFVEVNFSAAQGDLEKAWKAVQCAQPHAVCPVCQGHPKLQEKGCAMCKGRGFISKFRFDTVVPDDVKKARSKMAKEAK